MTAVTSLTPDEVVLPLERSFVIGDREVVLRPLPIAAYKRAAEDLGAIAQRIIREHPELELTRLDQHVDVLLPVFLQWIGRLLERFVGIEEAYVEEHVDLAQASAIIVALFEVNQLPVIRGNVARALQLARAIGAQ
jgi:hypothetical protein